MGKAEYLHSANLVFYIPGCPVDKGLLTDNLVSGDKIDKVNLVCPQSWGFFFPQLGWDCPGAAFQKNKIMVIIMLAYLSNKAQKLKLFISTKAC